MTEPHILFASQVPPAPVHGHPVDTVGSPLMANYIYPNVSKYWITIASSLDGLDVLNRTRIEFISLGVPWPSSSTTLRTEWTVSNVTRPDRLLLVKGGIQRSCVSLCALWGSGLSSLNNQTRSHCPLFFILGRRRRALPERISVDVVRGLVWYDETKHERLTDQRTPTQIPFPRCQFLDDRRAYTRCQ